MTLREGVEFHNGEKLTAQTLADMFVIQQTGSVSAGIISAATLVSVEATDDVTAVYTLSATNSAFPANLARPPISAWYLIQLLQQQILTATPMLQSALVRS